MRQEVIYLANHWSKGLVCLLVLVILLTPFTAQGAVVPLKSLPLGRLVENSPAQLRELGCSRLILDTTNSTVLVPAGRPFYVTSRDDPDQHFACSREASAHLQVIPGEVKAVFLTVGLIIGATAAVAWAANYLTEAVTGTSIVDRVIEGVSGTVKGYVSRQGATMISFILMVVNRLGLWFIAWTGNMFVWIMVYDRFGSSEFVKAGWPFIQGLANIGFILALLFIALSTVLRLDFGGGVRRLLPRLLVAALLVNFSLLIGTLLIDMSRLVMAALIFMIGDINPKSLSAMILKNTAIYQNEFLYANKIPILMSDADLTEAQREGLAGPWILVMSQAASMLLVWMMTFAFIVLSFSFAIRYVILLILLTISPLAYLAVALPGAKGMVDKYWKTFMKWVLFGPAAVLLLVLITKTGTFNLVPDNADKANTFEHISQLVIVAIMIYTAIFAGNYVGGVGGNLSLSLAKGINNRVRRGLVGGAKLGGKGLYVGTGTRAALRGARAVPRGIWRQGRDLGRTVAGNIGSRVRRRLGMPKRDEKGVPLPGQKPSLGQRFGGGIVAASKEAAAARQAGSKYESAALSAANLARPDVGRALSKNQITGLIGRNDTRQQISMVNNIEIVGAMDSGQQNNMINTLREKMTASGASPVQISEANRMLSDFNRTMRAVYTRSTKT